ncbi:unnamed protein product [Tetraodon nigroviridis]|uniref:(spotted green pufferfish) hypothetical protein n=1 Tax=Tetraodon nigroviridis TaxID=99883 RepID=Q4RVH5_TETNG|nr:unnamed protein product [Tetraodon nigroviridis]
MDETDIMDLTHQKARKRPRPISSVDESVHASLKRLPMRAAECRESSLMYAVRGEPVPAASLKQNDHPVNSSPNSVMPAQVKASISSAHFVRVSGVCVPAAAELSALTGRATWPTLGDFLQALRVHRMRTSGALLFRVLLYYWNSFNLNTVFFPHE